MTNQPSTTGANASAANTTQAERDNRLAVLVEALDVEIVLPRAVGEAAGHRDGVHSRRAIGRRGGAVSRLIALGWRSRSGTSSRR